MKKTNCILLALLTVFFILAVTSAFAAPVGKITAMEGKVDLTPAGAKEAVAIAVGTAINTGDILRAKSKSKAEITFVDGNIMRIAENSRIRVTQYQTGEGQKSYFNLFRGKTQAVVDNLKKGSNFEVHTPTAICGVRGSIFFSMYINGQSSFVFSRGAGYGYNINRPDQVIAIPTKILMVVPRADKAPLLRPASDTELDKHLKDTTPTEKPKEKEAAKEEKKPAGGDTQAAKQEGPKQEEAKKEEAKPAAQEKQTAETAPATPTEGTKTTPATTTTSPTAPAQEATMTPTPVTIDPAQIEQQLQQTQQAQQAQQAVQSQQTQQKIIIEQPKDNTPPEITVTPQYAFPGDNGRVDVNLAMSSNEDKTDYQYRTSEAGQTPSGYQATSSSLDLKGLNPTGYQVDVNGTDALGNKSADKSTSFTLSRHDVTGKSWATGDMTSTNVIAKFAGVSRQSWGSWQLSDNGSGTPASSWNYYAGNTDDTNFIYWLQKASGTAATGSISGTSSEITYLSRSVLGTGSNGSVSGTYTEGDGASWNATDTGRGKYTETPLSFWGKAMQFSDNFVYWSTATNDMNSDSTNRFTGMIGGTQSIWSGSSSFTGLGSYYNPDATKRTLWETRFDETKTSIEDSSVEGRFRGWLKGITKADNSVEGIGRFIYIKKPQDSEGKYETGYLTVNNLTGAYYPGISMWKYTGNIDVTSKGTTSYSPDTIGSSVNYRYDTKRRVYGENGNITGYKKDYYWDIPDQNWGMTFTYLGGTYSGTIASNWAADIGLVESDGTDAKNRPKYYVGHIAGNAWTAERIAGTITGNTLGWYSQGTISSNLLGNLQSGSQVWQGQSLDIQEWQPLKFAALIGNWTDDSGGREGSKLYYARTPAYTMTSLEAQAKTPTRIGLTWSVANMDIDTHAWIPPYAPGKTSYQLLYSNQGTNRTPYRYPYAYLDTDDTTGTTGENLYNYMYQKGDTYYAVYKWSSGSDVPSTTKIYNRTQKSGGWDETLLSATETSQTLTDANPWWYVYKIHLNTNDPEEVPTIYRVNVLDTEAPTVLRYVADDGNISGILGSTKSFIQGAGTINLPLRLMGEYTKATSWNRVWAQELIAYNANQQKYITYDEQPGPGTFFGTLGGAFLPGQKKVAGYLYAFAINQMGQANLLKGSFGTGSDLGTVYPGLSMWDADGQATKYEMNVSSGIQPGSLPTGRWYYVAPTGGATDSPFDKTNWGSGNDYLDKIHLTSWLDPKSNRDKGNSWGMFADSALTKPTSYLTFREDYLDIYKLKNDSDATFGVWGWRAFGRYQTEGKDAKWILSAKLELNDGSYEYDNPKFQINTFAYGGAWANDQFTGKTVGNLGDGKRGVTGLIAGNTAGTYNDTPNGTTDYEYNTFAAVTAGSWINTNRFLQMLDDTAAGGGKENLAALGYPTTAYTNTTSFSGELASKSSAVVNMSNLRILNAPDHEIVRIYATDNVSSQQGTALTTGAIYPVTSAGESLPFYGRVTPEFTETHESRPNTWLGYFHGIGVFTKTDGSYAQGSIGGPVAGTYGEQFFSGTSAGEWTPSPFLTLLKDADKTYLKYVSPCGTVLYNEEGYIKGLLGTTEPIAWTDNLTYPDYTEVQFTGVWVPGATSSREYPNHFFAAKIFPTNFESGGYTTTKGASYWGTLSGIHQYRSGSSQDGMEALMTTVFVDANKNFGVLYGKIGGPYDENTNNYWGFDRANQAFSIDSYRNKISVIKVGTTSTTTASSLKSVMEDSGNHTEYTYRGGVISNSPYLIGKFFDTGGNPVGNLNLGNPDPAYAAVTGLVDAWSLPDSSETRAWAIWQTNFYGSFDQSGTPDYWQGEIQTPDSSSPTKLMGAKLNGERWADNRTAGAVIGFWANIAQASAATGISVGNFIGTFDPSQYTYQAVASGGSLETTKFLAMAGTPVGSTDRETLRALNIPCVNVGMATLAQQAGTTVDNMQDVTMTDVKFFAYSTGTAPVVWATNNVRGNVVGTPTGSQAVTLKDNWSNTNISANFTMKTWDTSNKKWLATVSNGSGNAGSGTNVQNLKFRGAAAGNISGSNFNGTAAGVVKQGAAAAQ